MKHGILLILIAIATVTARPGASGAEKVSRLRVRSVTFEGNEAFTGKWLQRTMLTRPSAFLSRSYYYEHILDDDVKSLELFYRRNGYLEGRVEGVEVAVDSAAKAVDVTIMIGEGELTRIEGVTIFGNSVFSDSVIGGVIGVKRGDPFKQKRIEDATLVILTKYANRGYLEAEIKPEISIAAGTHRALVDFFIAEGGSFRIGHIRMPGLEKTSRKVVLRELNFREGEIIEYARLLESQRRLYLTGLFRSVFIRPVDPEESAPGKKDILIECRESESIEFNVAVGYGAVEKVRTRFEIVNNNLAGTARKIGLSTKASFKQFAAEGSFTEPRTFGFRLRTDVNLMLEYLEEPGYDLLRMGGRAVVGRNFGRRSTVSLAYRYERAKLTNIKVSSVSGELETDIQAVKLSLIYDGRDNLFNAQRGSYLEWSGEVAGAFLGGSESFARFLGRVKRFIPATRTAVLAAAAEVGWIEYLEGDDEVPLHERFYAGGPSSLRGFGYRLAGPRDPDGTPVGGNLMVVFNLLEVRQVLYKMVGGVLFLDAGNVWPAADDFDLEELRTCAGFGLRANTPIGIVRCDVGFNMDKKRDEDASRVYFSVGQAF